MLSKYSTTRNPFSPNSQKFGGSLSSYANINPSATAPAPMSSSGPMPTQSSYDKNQEAMGITTAATGVGSLMMDDTDYDSAYEKAMDMYLQEMGLGEDALKSHEAQGRSDIEKYLGESNKFGEPYRKAGSSALTAWMGALGLGGPGAQQYALKAFTTSPGYQFALNQGLQGIQSQNSASGMRDSGSEQIALNNYATQAANKEYKQWEDQLKSITGMGRESAESAAQRTMGAGTTLAQLDQMYGKDFAQLYSSIASAQAEAEIAKTKAKAQQQSSQGSAIGEIIGGTLSAFGL